MSIGIRYFNMQNFEVKEEFLGFSAVEELNSEGIANALIKITNGLNMSKLIGVGFDGCSTMSGKINRVQSIIRRKYPMACFYHCASHKLNLGINDQNAIPDIRNTSSTIKDIIRFFRVSIIRRKLIPNVPLFCETRWSEKYKSIRLFSKNFVEIKTVLYSLAHNNNLNVATRNRAFQLSCATSNIRFLVILELISFYSAIVEPVVIKLQAVSVNLHKVHSYVKNDLIRVLKNHRDSNSDNFQHIFNIIIYIAEKFNINVNIPRRTDCQTHRANYNSNTPFDYYRVSIYIPYLNSIISSLEARFSEHNETLFKLGALIPSEIVQIEKKSFNIILEEIQNHFKIDNLIPCGLAWYSFWENKSKTNSKEFENFNLFHLLKNECDFF